MRIRIVAVALVVAGLLSAQSVAQESGAPKFDVVSVVIDHEASGGAGDSVPRHGTWQWKRIPLSFLVMYAYDVSLNQIAGIPKDFQGPEAAFDIRAKMPVTVTDAQFRLMLQSLLADRFQFSMHREMRELPVNTIEVAKDGPKLTPASGKCIAGEQAETKPPDQFRCGEVAQRPNVADGMMHWRYVGRSVSMSDLARALSSGSVVVDDSKIEGLYDIDVTVDSPMGSSTDDASEQADRQYQGQRAFKAAFEKQLGLSIDKGKVIKKMVPFIVIDHVEMPSGN